jgi:hypothetical protein
VRHNRAIVGESLGQEEAIERILVVPGQLFDEGCVPGCDRERLSSGRDQCRGQVVGRIELSQRPLDRHLRHHDRADQHLIAVVG